MLNVNTLRPYPYSLWCPKNAKTRISYIDISVLLASAGKASWQETTVACCSCYGLEEVQYFFQWLWIPTLKTSDCVFQLFSLSFSPAPLLEERWLDVCVCTWWVYSKLNWDRLWQSSNPYNQRRRPPSRRRSGRHREKIDHQTWKTETDFFLLFLSQLCIQWLYRRTSILVLSVTWL